MSALLLCLVLAQTPATATPYEERLVSWALGVTHRELEPSPEGKPVEEVLLQAEHVFAPSDPWPELLNAVHVRTRERVLLREVLLSPGDAWSADLVAETERNLRALFILAVAKVVPVKGTHGGVALLVVTKDRWSLRLNSEFTLIGPLVQYLRLRPTEMNFRGLNQQLALDAVLRLDTLTLGQSFVESRVLDTKLSFSEAGNLIFNRATGKVEGSSGGAQLGLPLRTLDQPWGSLVEGSWNVRRRRVFRGASIWQLPFPSEAGEPTIPYVYDVREGAGEASITRSLGRASKTNLTAAVGGFGHQYTPPPEPKLPDDQRQYFQATFLPRSESATYVSANVLFFQADYRVLRDLETYQLSEDYQLGARAFAAVRWAVPTPLAAGNFVDLAGALRYRLFRADDLFSVAVAASVRLRPGESPANERLVIELKNHSPTFEGGRFVVRLLADLSRDDLTNRQFLLGGSTGLRGAFPEALTGRNLALANFEFRARPFEIATQWVGLVLFSDVGSAFDTTPRFTVTTGFGLRLLLPHFNQEVIRVDFGLVVGGEPPGLDRLNASYGQVTEMRPGFLDLPL